MSNSEITETSRPISKRLYNFLSAELLLWREKQIITAQQFDEITAMYEQKNVFAGSLMSTGMILVGFALLSYIAANWLNLSIATKITLIISAYVGSVLAAFYFEKISVNMSRGFLIFSSFIYGGGIFLIAQIFHDGGHYTKALFWWMLGIMPVFWIFKDKAQLLLIQLIMFSYFHGTIPIFYWHYSPVEFNIWDILSNFRYQIAMTVCLWVLWLRIKDRITFNMNVLISTILIGALSMVALDGNVTNTCLNIIILGILMSFVLSRFNDDFAVWGVLLIGGCGIILSYPNFWERDNYLSTVGLIEFVQRFTDSPLSWICIGIGVGTSVIMLFLTRKGNIIADILFGALILRYYFDTFYDFIPKSMFFAVGGILLVITGIIFEKLRRHRRGGAK